MEAYRSFAGVYDMFMDNVDYDRWSDYLNSLLKERGIADGLVLDLGCGTGSITLRLAQAGYDMIGVDLSADMLQIAQEKKEKADCDILYLQQDMCEFELYGTVRAVVCVCDSVNYLTEEEEVLSAFRLVNNYLDPGGIFIFDFNTIHKYETMGETTIAENRREASFIWENYYDREERINEYDLTLFIREGEENLFRKYEETHFQRGYSLEKLKELLEEAGMVYEGAYDGFTRNLPEPDSERICVVAREQGKELTRSEK
ncbi:MAG: class I SAM-dependent DNA methyltransferase [Ruminococcus sp.]